MKWEPWWALDLGSQGLLWPLTKNGVGVAKPELGTAEKQKGAMTVVDKGLQTRKEDRERMEGTGIQDYWRKSHWHLGYLGYLARHMPSEGRVAGLHLDGGCSDSLVRCPGQCSPMWVSCLHGRGL